MTTTFLSRFTFLPLLCCILLLGCKAEPEKTIDQTAKPDPLQATGDGTTVAANGDFLMSAAAYFQRHQHDNGRLEYLINPEKTSSDNGIYNVVRHAGVLYSLAAYIHYTGDRQFDSTWGKASEYMWEINVKPVDDTGHLAVWSVPGENFYADSFAKAKIGATGLGLVGWILGERLGLAAYLVEDLRKLGDFLLYMQEEDGRFYSSYHERAGRTDLGKYQYYPGEAALGLCFLYEKDKQEKWLEGAIKAISVPANNREEMASKAIDHWDLIATAKVFDILRAAGNDLSDYEYLLTYCQSLVDRLLKEYEESAVKGSFTNDHGTTPTATRIEGLTAIYPYLDPSSTRAEATEVAIREAVAFIRQSQIQQGKLKGGVPLSTVKKDTTESKESQYAIDRYNDKAAEIRIDYVQHAMSAVLGHDLLCKEGLIKTN